jgi:5'(3')-deoxyribonucleotidase
MYAKETPKVIAVDLDQTLANTLEKLVEWHNDTFDTHFSVTDFNTTDYWKIWGGNQQETYMKIRDFYDSDYFNQIQPIQDFALEALKMLKSRHFTLVIITSRQQFIADKTKNFVDKHYPGKKKKKGLTKSIY